MISVTTVRFSEAGKLYDFEPAPFDIKRNDKVIVETDSGEELATVAYVKRKVEEDESRELKHIIRKATAQDIVKYESLVEKGRLALPYVKSRVKELGLSMGIVNVEFSFDKSKVTINFTAEERVDFRALLKDLASYFKKRVELRQIGARDETRLIGGLGVCGQPCCCHRFLDDFGHATVKMAKNQNLSLNPTKISGLCGRLMCCLAYENQAYTEAQKNLPKLGSDVSTPNGTGKLVSANIVKETATVKFVSGDDTTISEFKFCDISRCEKCNGCNAAVRSKNSVDESQQNKQERKNKQKNIKEGKGNGIQN